MALPMSTDVNVQIQSKIPAATDVVVCFAQKGMKGGRDLSAELADDLAASVDALLGGGVVTGKSNEITSQWIASSGTKGRRLLVVGLGTKEKFSVECLREAGGAVGKYALKHKLRSLAIVVPDVLGAFAPVPGGEGVADPRSAAVEAIAGGFQVGTFDFREYKGTGTATAKLDRAEKGSKSIQLTLVTSGGAGVADALNRARIVSEGQNFARTIASRPGNNINPVTLAKVAQQLAREVGLGIRVLDEKEMAKLGMGGILAVGAGSSATPPRMIVLEYRGAGAKGASKSAISNPLLVVGKAITFDTGGISIKPAEKMGKMIFDKCGGMAVLGLMYAVAKLKLPISVVGILSSAENHISETAYRPGDYLRMYNGVTVEVTNTDAEGRLVLGDALAWGIETYKPSAVVDLATLTGGVVVALGKTMAGVMSNDDGLVDELTRAGELAGEKMWRLPVGEDQRDYIKSEPADIVNSGGREGSPLQGAAFISFFVKFEGDDKIPWAHLDIAGVADTEKELPMYAKGSTGWGVRTLVEWVKARAGSGAVASGKVKDKKVPRPAGG